MKMTMCQCELNGLVRPKGPIKIKSTEVVNKDVLVARLDGAIKGTAKTVRHNGKYYFVPPKGMGKIEEVPADSLTDALHAEVFVRNHLITTSKKKSKSKKQVKGKRHAS